MPVCKNGLFNSWIQEVSYSEKRKFNTLYKQYKEDKIVNNISQNDCHDCKFYESLDT
jgi:hypothetical protein